VPADKKSPGPIKRAIRPGCIAYGLSLIPVRAEVGRHWFDSASRLAAFESVQVVFERSKIGLEQFEGALGILRVCASSFQPRNSGFLLIDKIPRVHDVLCSEQGLVEFYRRHWIIQRSRKPQAMFRAYPPQLRE
jgi:hypothetical protein